MTLDAPMILDALLTIAADALTGPPYDSALDAADDPVALGIAVFAYAQETLGTDTERYLDQ